MIHIETKNVTFTGEATGLELTITLLGSGFDRLLIVGVHRQHSGSAPVEVARMRSEFSIVDRTDGESHD